MSMNYGRLLARDALRGSGRQRATTVKPVVQALNDERFWKSIHIYIPTTRLSRRTDMNNTDSTGPRLLMVFWERRGLTIRARGYSRIIPEGSTPTHAWSGYES